MNAVSSNLAAARIRIIKTSLGIWKGVSLDVVALNLSIWLVVEVLLCFWNRSLGDFISKFIDVELLFAQFLATFIVWIVALIIMVIEASRDPNLSLSRDSYEKTLMLKEEASKVPIFFGSAIFISSVYKLGNLIFDWKLLGFSGLYVFISWCAGGFFLMIFAGIVNYKSN